MVDVMYKAVIKIVIEEYSRRVRPCYYANEDSVSGAEYSSARCDTLKTALEYIYSDPL